MEIILRQDVDTLGSIGDVLTVKDGYARNYLIPQGLAYFASASYKKKIEAEKKQYLIKMAHLKEAAERLSETFADLQVTIAMKVGDEGRLFGSVTSQMISAELSIMGHEIDKRNVIITDPIKTLGVFSIKVKLHPEVVTPLKVWVISEE